MVVLVSQGMCCHLLGSSSMLLQTLVMTITSRTGNTTLGSKLSGTLCNRMYG